MPRGGRWGGDYGGGGGQDSPPPLPPAFVHSLRMLCLLKSWVLLVPLGTQLESICEG